MPKAARAFFAPLICNYHLRSEEVKTGVEKPEEKSAINAIIL
jgi:hypothetical protein